METSITTSGQASDLSALTNRKASGGGAAEDPRPPVDAFVELLVHSVQRADAAFQIRQFRGKEALPDAVASELIAPDALDALVPRLAVTKATFTFWAETAQPDFGTGIGAWFRRKWRDVKRAWNALLGRPFAPTYTSDLVVSGDFGEAADRKESAVRISVTVERQRDGTYERDVQPSL